MQIKKVWPAPGAKIVDPRTGHEISPGEAVEMTSYFARRVADGDLLLSPPDAEEAAVPLDEESPTPKPKRTRQGSPGKAN